MLAVLAHWRPLALHSLAAEDASRLEAGGQASAKGSKAVECCLQALGVGQEVEHISVGEGTTGGAGLGSDGGYRVWGGGQAGWS